MLVSEAEVAYLAGILDGEGTFTVYKTGSSYHALVAIASTSKELIDWLQARFNGSSSEMPDNGSNREQSWQWQLRYKPELAIFLPQVIPFLLIKKLQAQLFLKYTIQHLDARRGKRLTPEDIALRDAYCTLFENLNSVGRGSSLKKAKIIKMFLTGGVTLP